MDLLFIFCEHTFNRIQNFDAWLDPQLMADVAAVILALLTLYIGYEYFFFCLRRKKRNEIKFIKKDPNFIYNIDECPICYNGFTIPVVRAPCGHAYCMTCLLSYFTTNYLEWKCVCPLCRAMVNDFSVVESFGNPPTLTSQQVNKTQNILTLMVKQQNKDLFLSKPWPIVKGLVYIVPFLIIIFLIKYSLNEEVHESGDIKVYKREHMIF